VTGATGFIGSNLVAALRHQGWAVVCVVRRPVKSHDPGIVCVTGDLLEVESMNYARSEVGEIDVLFHLGAMLPAREPAFERSLFLMANTFGAIRLLQTAINMGIPSIVYASGVSIIGKPEVIPITEDHPIHPVDPYQVSKLCAELYCQRVSQIEHKQIVSLRITSPYGQGMSPFTVLSRFAQQAIRSEDIFLYGTGNRRQNFVHVSDVVFACLLAAKAKLSGVYNVAGSASISMRELAELVVRLAPGSRSRVRSSGSPDPQDDYRWEVDLTRSESRLGYRPMLLFEEGLTQYIESLQSGARPNRWWSPL